jgi:antagonist of KipI
LTEEWKVSSQSDRVGYRLEGATLKADPVEIYSEPVRLGSIQVPDSGQPIVTMPDGPTVGGYPKIAVVDDKDIPWIAQCRPSQTLRFQLVS